VLEAKILRRLKIQRSVESREVEIGKTLRSQSQLKPSMEEVI
jgi:hypothetical protein